MRFEDSVRAFMAIAAAETDYEADLRALRAASVGRGTGSRVQSAAERGEDDKHVRDKQAAEEIAKALCVLRTESGEKLPPLLE